MEDYKCNEKFTNIHNNNSLLFSFILNNKFDFVLVSYMMNVFVVVVLGGYVVWEGV